MKLLVSNTRRSRARAIRRALAPLGVETRIANFNSDLVAEADAVLPLDGRDICYLQAVYPQLAGRKYLAPDAATFALCEDKQALMDRLQAAGFAAALPLPRPSQPAIRKPRVGTGGACATRCIYDDLPGDPAWTWQRWISADTEYAAHLLVGPNGEILMSRQVSYVHAGNVRRGLRDGLGRVRPLPEAHLKVFAAMLAEIGFRGFCCFDYFVEGDQPQVLELNARIGGSLMRMPEAVGLAYCQALLPGATADWPAIRWPGVVRQSNGLRGLLARLDLRLPRIMPRRSLRPGLGD